MMMRFRRSTRLLTLCAVAAGVAFAATQPTFQIVAHTYKYAYPFGLIEGSPGVFYSEATSPVSTSILFSVTAGGALTVLASFPNGAELGSQVNSGADGLFYSEFAHGNYAAYVFSVTAAPDSRQVYAPQTLVPALTQNLPGGDLLSVALRLTDNLWNVARVGLDGTVTSIYELPAGERLDTALYASDGNYYGVSQGTNSYVFRATPSGTPATLYTFPEGSFADSVPALLEATDGNLYGVTSNGGADGTGTIYKLTLSGQYTLLHTFPKGSKSYATSLIEGSDGNLYGGTADLDGPGQLFRITTSGDYTPLYVMQHRGDGFCTCYLVQGSDGLIYGAALGGGLIGGTIFSLDVGLPKPAPRTQHFSPASGAAGTQVRLWGYNLLNASVLFNGVAATTVSNSGPNYVWATVPEDATTGPITVITPGGTVTTTTSFTVE